MKQEDLGREAQSPRPSGRGEVKGGAFCWVALLSNLATTQPTLARSSVPSAGVPNINLTPSTYRIATGGTGVSSLAPITPGANSLTGATFFLVGLS